jgi:hypothetical protein
MTLDRRCWLVLILFSTLLPLRLSAQDWMTGRDVVTVLGSQGRRAFELARLRQRDEWLQNKPLYQSVWLRESGAADSNVFDLLPFASAPRSRNGIALAYDQGTGSRMWSGFTEADPARSALMGSAAQALLGLWRRLSPIDGGPRDLLHDRRCPGMRARVGAEVLHGFGTDGRDAPPGTRAVILYADCRRDLGSSWQLVAGLRGYSWRSLDAPDRQDIESSVRLAHLPSHPGLVLFADGSWTPRYERVLVHIERPFTVSRIRFRPFARLGWGQNLPFGLGFWPGGYDGFPGLKDGQGRGNREAMAALDMSRPVLGKLSLRAILAVGRTATGGPVLPAQAWLLGARAGLNLVTRLGLVRVEYGRATESHRAIFLRLGRVF